MSLHRSLYRSVLKNVDKVYNHYGQDLVRTSRSVFGPAVDPSYWSTFGTHPRDAVRAHFRLGLPVSMPARSRPVMIFDLLKKLSAAIGDPVADAMLIHNVSLYRGNVAFEVACYVDEKPPPPRLGVNGDPFWNTQLCVTGTPCPWREAMLWSPTHPTTDLSSLSTTSTTTTHNVQITCSTKLVVPAGLASSQNVYEYEIKIKNVAKKGGLAVQLLSRHWYFLDWELSAVSEVWGKGVAGQYPILLPGEEHTYSSGTDLTSEVGIMKGLFQFARLTTQPEKEKKKDAAEEQQGVKKEKKAKAATEEKGGADKDKSAAIGKRVDVVDVWIRPTLLARSSATSETTVESSKKQQE